MKPMNNTKNTCRLCGGKLSFKFNLQILKKYDISYFEFIHCYSLQAEEPYWLDEAYKQNISNLDTGAVQRNLNNFAICYTFAKIFNVNRAIDFGSSDGLLCRFLRDHMIDAYCTDKYSVPKYAQNFTLPPTNNIDLITGFEVLEHLSDPNSDLDEIFSYDPKYFLCSTELYISQDENWWYLSKESGQHVFFYTAEAINFIADKYGYSVTKIGDMLLFYKLDIINIKEMIASANTCLTGWVFKAIKSFIFNLHADGIDNDYYLIKNKLSNDLNN